MKGKKNSLLKSFIPKKDTEKTTGKFEASSENVRFLLEQKVSYLHTVATICMSWWVSSIVFCGSIIAAVWVNRGDLFNAGIISELGWFVGFFFGSFICFGVAAIYYLGQYRIKINSLIASLNQADSNKIPEDIFKYEINSIICGVIIGIITFILILVVWFCLCTNLAKGHWQSF